MTITFLDRPAPVDDASRRQFLIGDASMAALLAGCGGSESTERITMTTGLDGEPATTVVPR